MLLSEDIRLCTNLCLLQKKWQFLRFFAKKEALLSRMYFWKIATLLKTGALWHWMVYCCIQLFEMCDAVLFVFFKICNWSAWIIVTQTERLGSGFLPRCEYSSTVFQETLLADTFKQCMPSCTDIFHILHVYFKYILLLQCLWIWMISPLHVSVD